MLKCSLVFSFVLCVLLCVSSDATDSAVPWNPGQPNTENFTSPLVVDMVIDVPRVRSVSERTQTFEVEITLRMVWETHRCLEIPQLCEPITNGLPFAQFDNANDMEVQTAVDHCDGLPKGLSCIDTALKLKVFKEFELYDFFYDSQNLTTLIEMWWPTSFAYFRLNETTKAVNILDRVRGARRAHERSGLHDWVSPTSGVPNGWDFSKVSIFTYHRVYPEWAPKYAFSAISMTVLVKRNPSVWLVKILLPIIVIAVFTFASFVMGLEKGMLNTRIINCFSSLLLYQVFQLFLQDQVPAVDYLSYTDYLFAQGQQFVLIVLVITVILRALVELKHRLIANYVEHNDKNQPVLDDDQKEAYGRMHEISPTFQRIQRYTPIFNLVAFFVTSVAYVIAYASLGNMLGLPHPVILPDTVQCRSLDCRNVDLPS